MIEPKGDYGKEEIKSEDFFNLDMRRSRLLKLNGRRLISCQEAVKSLSKLFPHLSEYAIMNILSSQKSNVLNNGVEELINLAEKQSEPPKEFPPIPVRDTVSEMPDNDDRAEIEIDNKDTVSEMNVKATGDGWVKRNIKKICGFFKIGKHKTKGELTEKKPIIQKHKTKGEATEKKLIHLEDIHV